MRCGASDAIWACRKIFLERQPFPGPGLAVRILGEVTAERVAILQEADDIVVSEIKAAGLYRKVWQSFAVLLPVRASGVMGDQRTYANTCAVSRRSFRRWHDGGLGSAAVRGAETHLQPDRE
jgi:GMP synthase PP-ATPase subunit